METELPALRFLLILLTLTMCGFGACKMSLAQELGKPAIPAPSAETIEIICHYGIGGKNQLDTVKGTFTYDMVIDPPIVIQLALSEMERKEILNAALTAGFFSMPNILPLPEKQGTDFCMGPCRTYYLSIKTPQYLNEVSLDNCRCAQQEEEKKLSNLVKLITSIIASKSEFKALPKPRAGYL
jgi:hypothetical protein